MRRVTHVVFSTGLVAFLAVRVLGLTGWDVLLPVLLASIMQYVIDAVSHEEVYVGGRVVSRRTPLLHSPSGVLLVSLAFTGLALAITGFSVWRATSYLALMASAASSHLLLDSLTERGVYVRGRRVYRRRMFRTDNPILNTVFTLAGLTLLYTALQPPPSG